MKSKFVILSCLLFGLITNACNDSAIEPQGSKFEIYNMSYSVNEAVLWKFNKVQKIPSVMYEYTDSYVKDGENHSDSVEGFAAGTSIIESGNIMVCLYSDGLIYNESLNEVKGIGSVISIHFTSSDTEDLAEGKYTYSADKLIGTYEAFVSSLYNTESVSTPAVVDSGIIDVRRNGSSYTIDFDCKTKTGGVVRGCYIGELSIKKVVQPLVASYSDLTLAGLMDSVTTTSVIFGSSSNTVDYDYSNGRAFLSTASGSTKLSSDGGKDVVDISLRWNGDDNRFEFKSPIVMRSYLNHDDEYNFPCHTTYMLAPNSFTDDSYNNLENTGFDFEVTSQDVYVPTNLFETTYVMFMTGNGVKGVIKVKGYTPMGSRMESFFNGLIISYYQVNPTIILDMKCAASFKNPQIK